ncbi:MAG: cytochrome bc complex cytochrome b subunit [Acidobacteriota bacterium]|nr:cytochrome bc complex cytochrome b subunit [Blastocatellia bacterium]MDW8413773.1 cytochrome bc complex cytochrome b subunit [Acidobacteriota bacterium]
MFRAFSDFLSARFPVEKMNFNAMVAKKEVPVHKMSWAYYLGGLSLFFLIVQVVTGLMLLFYYEPTVSDAHASVEFITKHVSGGALIRNMHSWSASAMIFCVMAHMLTAFAMKAFERPRELIWVTGVIMLLLTFTFGFTGYLLPWNQIAVNATKVGLQSIEEIGTFLPQSLSTLPRLIRETIQGEASVGQATLSRFYALHVVVLPLLMFAVLALHLFSIQLHGMSKGVDSEVRKTEKFFPDFMIKDLTLWGVVFLVLFIVALCLPFESFFSYPLSEPYNPLGSTPEGIKPEWYFYFLYYPLEMLPFWVVFLVTNAAVLVLLLAPWIFRGTSRRTLRVLAVVITAYLVLMTVFGEQIYYIVKGGQ